MTKNREKFITFFSCKKLGLLCQMCLRKCIFFFFFFLSIVLFAAVPSRADCPLNSHNIRESSIKYNSSSGGQRYALLSRIEMFFKVIFR